MILTFILYLLKALGVVKVSWFIVFVPFLIVLAVIISFIVFLLIMSFKSEKYVAKFEHDIRMKELDRNFKKDKEIYGVKSEEFKKRMERIKGKIK